MDIKKCEVEWCDRTSLSHPARVSFHNQSNMILCDKHKQQFKRYGTFQKHTKFDSNEILYIDDVVMKLGYYNEIGELLGEFIIDKEDYDKIKNYKWFFKSNKSSVVTNVQNKDENVTHLKLHNIIMNIETSNENGIIVDHIDGNVLNNRKSNLRIANRAINSINKKIQSNNSTGVVGVVQNNNSKKWIPQIKINYKMIRLGTRNTFDEAVQIRLSAESKYFYQYSRNYNQITNTIQLEYLSLDDNKMTFVEVDMDGNVVEFKKIGSEL